MEIYCPNCALQITLDQTLFGSKGQCPRCSYKFIIEQEHRHPPDADDLGTAPTIKIETDESFDFDLGGARSRWMDSHSAVTTMAGGLLLGVAAILSFWAGTVEEMPRWAQFPGKFFEVFCHGALVLLATAMIMEILSRTDRFEYLRRSLPFILAMTLISVFGANVAAAFAFGGFPTHTLMSLGAAVVLTLASAMSFHLEDHPEGERSILLIIMALGMGLLAVSASVVRRGGS